MTDNRPPRETVVHGFTIPADLARPGMTFNEAHIAYQISLRRSLSARRATNFNLAPPGRNWPILILLYSTLALAISGTLWLITG